MPSPAGEKAARRPAPAPRKPALPKLPAITVAKYEAALVLVERMVAENTSVFIARGQEYRDKRTEGSSRQLTAQEAASLAAAVLDDERTVEDRAAAFQQSELRAHDEPAQIELLAAAGVATAPAFVKAARQVVALLEMPNDQFEQYFDEDDPRILDEAIRAAARQFGHIDMDEGRQRASRALDAFTRASGQGSGKGLGLLGRMVWQALQQATTHLIPDESVSALSMLSAASTADSPDGTSSTN